MMGFFRKSTSSSKRARERRKRRRRARAKADGRRTEDLYRTDLDRHLWTPRVRDGRRRRRRRRKLARAVASTAGMLGAAGLSYWLYRVLRDSDSDHEDASDDPEAAQADVEE